MPEVLPIRENQKHFSIEELAQKASLDLDAIGPDIRDRLTLLNEKTGTLSDEYEAIQMAHELFRYYEKEEHEKAFTANEKKTVTIGALLTDIGKTGPKHAAPDTKFCVTEIFAVDNFVAPTTPVSEFLTTFFPHDHERRMTLLEGIGIGAESTMREFWNLHSRWTLEILSGEGIGLEAVAAASTHHMLEGINPKGIVGENNKLENHFGENAAFDRSEKLIILLDKYQAARRRGQKTHQDAIGLLRKTLAGNLRFARDREFTELINDLDRVLANYSIENS